MPRGRKPKRGTWDDFVVPSPTEPPDPDDDAAVPTPVHSKYVDAPEPEPWTELEPLFPVGFFTPYSKCPHEGPLPEGSRMVCMVCHKSGKDGSKALPRDVKRLPDDPKPTEPEQSEDSPPAEAERPKTRRERRRELNHGPATSGRLAS